MPTLTGTFAQFAEGYSLVPGIPIRAPSREGTVGLGDTGDARPDRNRFPLEFSRVTAAIPHFVVVQHDLQQSGVNVPEAFQGGHAFLDVFFQQDHFLFAQTGGPIQNVVRDRFLAEVLRIARPQNGLLSSSFRFM